MSDVFFPVAIILLCVSLVTAAFMASGFISPSLHERTVKLKDGREIVCLVPRGYLARSISCDWSVRGDG